jgi:hypothetical protein
VWNWEYSLTTHFFETDRKELAIRIAEEMLKIVPDNSHYVVNLARLKRESNDVPGAIRLLEAATPTRDHRAFWVEWGVACGRSDDYASNAALNAYSISDDLSTNPPTLENGTLALAGLTRVFAELHKRFQHSALYRARAGCAWLGLRTDRNNIILSRELQQTSVDIGSPKDVVESISWLCAGLASALTSTPLAESVAKKVGNPAQFKFGGLQRLLERSG